MLCSVFPINLNISNRASKYEYTLNLKSYDFSSGVQFQSKFQPWVIAASGTTQEKGGKKKRTTEKNDILTTWTPFPFRMRNTFIFLEYKLLKRS